MEEPFKSQYTLDKTIPEGMRFGLNMTYDQIDTWVNSRTDLSPIRKSTARIFARAMKDYGMIVVDTNGGSPSIQTAGGINPDNAKKWTDLGMGPNDKDNMLDGLINASNLYVVDPPVATCTDGTKSKYYCDWISAQYSVASTSSPVPTTTTVSPTTTTVTPTTTQTISPSPSASSPGTPGSKASPSPSTSTAPTTDKTPPSVPTGISRGLTIDPTRVAYNLEIKWKASSDSGSGVKDYLITRRDGKSWTSISPVVVDNTITANILYAYEIKARDNAGNISAPATTSAKGACLLIWCWLE